NFDVIQIRSIKYSLIIKLQVLYQLTAFLAEIGTEPWQANLNLKQIQDPESQRNHWGLFGDNGEESSHQDQINIFSLKIIREDMDSFVSWFHAWQYAYNQCFHYSA
ncbi:hypothetical protein ACJX0J_011577, partial [Zea mays]